ncbi:MAG: hypothetical protein AAF492_25565, partial [Verrucomicrobiota bacterium]
SEPEKVGPGLIPSIWIAFKGMVQGIYQGFVHSFSGAWLFQMLPAPFRGLYKFFLIALAIFGAVFLDRKVFRDRRKLLLFAILTGWVFASYALPALGRASKGSHPSVIPKQMRYRYNPAVPAAGLAAFLLLSLRPVAQPGRYPKAATALAVFLPLVLFGNLQRIGWHIQARWVKSNQYRSTIEQLNREIDRLCLPGADLFIGNQPFRMKTLEGTPEMKWSVRPRWLYLVFGSGRCEGVKFVESQKATRVEGLDLVYVVHTVENQSDGLRLQPHQAERN